MSHTMDEEDACSLKIRAGKTTGKCSLRQIPHREEGRRAYFEAAQPASSVITDTADAL